MEIKKTEKCDILITTGKLLTKSGNIAELQEIAIIGDKIVAVGNNLNINPIKRFSFPNDIFVS